MRLAGAEEEQGAYILMDDFNLTWLANGAGGSRQPGLQAELRRLGVGPYACRHMSAKGDFYALRAENLRAPAANRR